MAYIQEKLKGKSDTFYRRVKEIKWIFVLKNGEQMGKIEKNLRRQP